MIGGPSRSPLARGCSNTEHVAKVSQGATKETWWAGATVTELAKQQGLLIFPETVPPNEGFFAREHRYAGEWLMRHGYTTIPENDAWYEELTNFIASVRDSKPVAWTKGLQMRVQ